MAKKVLRCGLTGDHISRSRLADAFELLCDRQGIGLDFRLIDTAGLTHFDLKSQIAELRRDGFDGLSITHPWKPQADQLRQKHSGYPAGLGASNLLKFGAGITGFNTDFTGFLAAWRAEFGNAEPGNVVIAGAGGVARAIACAVSELGASRISIWDTQAGLAQNLVQQLDPNGKTLHAIAPAEAVRVMAGATGVINATPMGTIQCSGMAIDPSQIGARGAWAFDAVYTPTSTAFLIAAGQAGLRCLSGFDLFRHMAVRSFSAYTGQEMQGGDADLLRKLAPR